MLCERRLSPLQPAWPDSSQLSESPKSFPCHTSEKLACKPFACHTSKIIGLEVLCLPHIRNLLQGWFARFSRSSQNSVTPFAKSFRIHTYRNRSRKSFGINTYAKEPGGGVGERSESKLPAVAIRPFVRLSTFDCQPHQTLQTLRLRNRRRPSVTMALVKIKTALWH